MDGLGMKQKVCSSLAPAARSGCFKGGDLLILCSLKTATPNLLLVVVSPILFPAPSLPHLPPQFVSVGFQTEKGV